MLNQLKTVLLLGVLTGILLAVGAYFGGQIGIIIAFGFVLLMNIATYWFSDKLVLRMYKANEADKKKNKHLYDIVSDIAKESGIPKPKVFIAPMPQPNAFATGRNPKNSVVAVTQGLLDNLDDKEIRGVLAHEMAHIKNRDILISTIAAVIGGAISFLAFMARWGAIFGGMRGGGGRNNGLELLALAILAPIIALIVRLGISRSREYLADETGAKFIHNGKDLASALKKINAIAKAHPFRFGAKTTSHMFIVNPFTRSTLLNLFSTHPPVGERCRRLEGMKF